MKNQCRIYARKGDTKKIERNKNRNSKGAKILPQCIQTFIKQRMQKGSQKGGPTGGPAGLGDTPYSYLFRPTLYLISSFCLVQSCRDSFRTARLQRGRPDLWATASSADLRCLVCVFGFLDIGYLVLCLWGRGVQIALDSCR